MAASSSVSELATAATALYPEGCGITAPELHLSRLEDAFVVDWGQRLGEGSNGNVVLCRSRSTAKVYALKYMPKSQASQHEILMHHFCTQRVPTAVIKLFAVYENDLFFSDRREKPVRHHLILMDYMEGGDILNHCASLAFKYTERAVSIIVRKIVTCIHELHEIDVAHRDVKPDNILWRYNEQGELDIRLSDLAFADFDSGYNLSSECGTPEYQAPETQIENPRVCRRGGTYTRACDVWSLGVTLYVFLSGCFPFDGQDAKAKLKQDYKFPPNTWGSVSLRGKAFTSTLLCAPPRLRPTTERLLDHPWLSDPDDNPKEYLPALELLVHLPPVKAEDKDSEAASKASATSTRSGMDVDAVSMTGTVFTSPERSARSDSVDDYTRFNTTMAVSEPPHLAAKRLDAMLKAKNRHGFGVPQVKPPRAMVSSTTSTNMDVDEAERRNSHFRAQPIRTQASTGEPMPEWQEELPPAEWYH